MKNDLGYFTEQGDFRTLTFFYRNWKGKCSYRKIKGAPVIWYGTTEHHKNPQWIMTGFDIDKDSIRYFAVADIIEFVKEENK